MTRTKSVKALLCVLLSMTLIIAFMPQTANVYAASAKKVTKITKVTSKASKYTMTAGTSKTFQVKLYPKKLTKSARTTYVSTSKKSVAATYSKKYKKTKYGYTYVSFKVKAVKAGTATVTAKAKSGKKVTWKITVKAAPKKIALTGVTLSKTKAVMVADELTATAAPSATSVEYQWYADGVAIDGATANTYTVEKAYIGKKLTVKATGLGKYTGTVTSAETEAVVKGAFSAAKIVDADGADLTTVYAGQVMSVKTTPIGAAKTATYQWYHGPAKLADGTSATYTVPATAVVGDTYTCVVTPDADSYTGTAITTTAVTVKTNMSLGTLTLSGTAAQVGTNIAVDALKIGTVTVDAANYSVAWYIDSVSASTQLYSDSGGTTAVVAASVSPAGPYYLKGATKATSLLGHTVIAVATGNGTTYTGKVTSAATAAVSFPIVTAPTIAPAAGEVAATVGTTYTCTTTPTDATVSYQWTREGVAIAGATTKAYTLAKADMDNKVACVVTGTGNYTGSKTSDPVSVTADKGTVNVGIYDAKGTTAIGVGNVSVGDVVTAVTTPASAKDSVTYQWYAGDTAISGATASTYTVTSAELGKTLTVKVTLTTAGQEIYGNGTTAVASTATGKVVAAIESVSLTIKDDATPTAAVTTNPYIGYTVTASHVPTSAAGEFAWYLDNSQGKQIYKQTVTPSAWATFDASSMVCKDATITLAYENKDATPATGVTYRYVDSNGDPISMAGHKLYCVYTGADTYLGSKKSATTGTVVDPVSKVALDSNAPQVGTKLNSTITLRSKAIDASNFTYQWYVGGVAVTEANGGTAANYTPVAADYGKVVKLVVTAKTTATTVAGTATVSTEGVVNTSATTPTVTALTGKYVVSTKDKIKIATTPEEAADTYTITWYRYKDGSPVATAIADTDTTHFTQVGTGSSYEVTSADVGYTVIAKITAGTGAYVLPAIVAYGILGSSIIAE